MSLACLSSFSPPMAYSSGPIGRHDIGLIVHSTLPSSHKIGHQPDEPRCIRRKLSTVSLTSDKQSKACSGVEVGTTPSIHRDSTPSSTVIGSYADHLRKYSQIESDPPSLHYGKSHVPHPGHLIATSAFGKPSVLHSYSREKDFFNISLPFLKHGFNYLSTADRTSFLSISTIAHLYHMWLALSSVDFSALRQPNMGFATQTHIPASWIWMFMALAFHYDLHIPSMIRYLGGNYTKQHLDVARIVQTMSTYGVPEEVIRDVQRIYTLGSPSSFFYEESLENATLYVRYGNHSSVSTNMSVVLATINKEERFSYCLPLPSWLYRFIPDIHINPQAVLISKDKSPRL